MKKTIKTKINDLKLNNLIDFILFAYMFSLYFFTFRDGLNWISNSIGLLFIFTIALKVLFKESKIVINKFLIAYIIFIGFCIVSAIFSINVNDSLIKIRTLILLLVMMTALIIYLDTLEKILRVMKFFIFSGYFISFYLLATSDLTLLARVGGELGNVNSIGLIIGISIIFSLYFIFEEKKYIYVPFTLIGIVVVLLTGSRKAIVFIAFVAMIIIFGVFQKLKKNRFKIILIATIFGVVLIVLIYKVPLFYNIIGRRFDNLIDILLKGGTVEQSLNLRYSMMNEGLKWFMDKPITGYGIDNFRYLYGDLTGLYTYSHNNIIELLVGVGLIGTIAFYLSQFIIMKNLIRKSKTIKLLSYTLLGIILGYMIMSIGLIYYYDKHICIIMALGVALYRLQESIKSEVPHKPEIKEND